MEQLFELVLEFVRLLLADVFEPRLPTRERLLAGRGHQRGVVHPIELKLKKQELRRSVGDLLLHVAIEFGARGIGGVAAIEQAGEGHQPPEQVLQRFISRDRLAKLDAGVGAFS